MGLILNSVATEVNYHCLPCIPCLFYILVHTIKKQYRFKTIQCISRCAFHNFVNIVLD